MTEFYALFASIDSLVSKRYISFVLFPSITRCVLTVALQTSSHQMSEPRFYWSDELGPVLNETLSCVNELLRKTEIGTCETNISNIISKKHENSIQVNHLKHEKVEGFNNLKVEQSTFEPTNNSLSQDLEEMLGGISLPKYHNPHVIRSKSVREVRQAITRRACCQPESTSNCVYVTKEDQRTTTNTLRPGKVALQN
jgi:hypothetical protein